MDPLAALFFRHSAEMAVATRKGSAFQDHFQDVMAAAHGSDFQRVRPAGSVGDRKCDGYLHPTRTVFQSYAPKRLENKATADKIGKDFAGAVAQWSAMRVWTFVHNDPDGLPPDAVQRVDAVKTANPGLVIDVWGPAEVLAVSWRLDPELLAQLYGLPPRTDELAAVGYEGVAPAVRAMAAGFDVYAAPGVVASVDPAKMAHNRFGPDGEELLRAGLVAANVVEGYLADQPDAGLRDRIAKGLGDRYRRLASRGGSADAVLRALYDPIVAMAHTSRESTAGLAVLAHLFETCDLFENPTPRTAGR